MKKFLYGIVLGSLLTCSFYALFAWNPFSSTKTDTKPDTSKYQSEITKQKIQERAAQKATQASKPTITTPASKKPSVTTTTKQAPLPGSSATKPTSVAKPTLAGKTITMTNKSQKELVIKSGTRQYTIAPGQTKKFDFESIQKAGVGYQGSIAPYRPLDLAAIALNLMRRDERNVNVNLIPGTIWAAKIADAKYTSPTPGAVSA